MIPRGQRNCNPLNIRRIAGTVWKGSLAEQKDPEFVEFASPVWGIRAAFCILNTYKRKHQAVCVEDIINRWAPPSENDTNAYIRAVCKATGFGGKERLTEAQWPRLVQAMAIIESGWLLSSEQLEKGFALFKGMKN